MEKAPISWEYVSELVPLPNLSSYLKARREQRWKVEHLLALNGMILVVSAQSSQYAPKKPARKATVGARSSSG